MKHMLAIVLTILLSAVTPADVEPINNYIYYDVSLTDYEQEVIQTMASENNVPYEIVLSIMKVESDFNRDAVGDGGDSIGIMQIQPKWLDKEVNLHDVIESAETGIGILSNYINKYGNLEKAIVCYNAGEYGSRGIYSTEYSRKVLDHSYKLIEEGVNQCE